MKIGLDAGHGLKTQGKETPDGIKEWTLNDKVRDKVIRMLKDYDVEIINCDNDEGNVDEGLTSRRTMYVNTKVDAFVSIHHNAYSGTWNSATGVEVYVDKNNTSKDMELAQAIYKNLPSYTGLKGRGIKKANFTVINQNQVPAVLVEGGFMDSKKDYKVITSNEGQEAYAKAVAEGLISFLKLEKKTQLTIEPKYKIGDRVKVSSYYASSTDPVEKAVHKVAEGIITTVLTNGARNPYLLNHGDIGWCNDGDIRGYVTTTEYYPRCGTGFVSIVNALNSIKVDSSYENRKKIATKNNIRDYSGSFVQNQQMLLKLKAGRLRKI